MIFFNICIFIFSLALLTPKTVAAQSGCQDTDINQDGIVDLTDYSTLVNDFFSTNPNNPRADINHDGIVDLSDYSLLVNNFFQTCPVNSSTPVPINNLFPNGDFEQGLTNWTTDAGTDGLTITNDAHSGANALRITTSQWVYNEPHRRTFEAGKTYKFTFWIKLNPGMTCPSGGSCWGGAGYRGSLANVNGGPLESSGNHVFTIGQDGEGVWLKQAITITNPTSTDASAQIHFNKYSGDDWTRDISIDDVRFFEVTGNAPPEVQISADVTSGNAPLQVNFTAVGDDPDGAIKTYRWYFGDSTESEVQNPTHTYLTRGTYQVKLDATDDNGLTTTQIIAVTVNDDSSPNITISEPSQQETIDTNNSTITIGGSSNGNGSQITTINWDNVSTELSGSLPVTPADALNWETPQIPLKYGKNRIFFTVIADNGKIGTDTIIINRTVSGPDIKNISTNTTSPRVYEKYEATFDVDTVADQLMFMYDPNPPAGVERYEGVTVEGVIRLPNGQTVTQPAFYNVQTVKDGSSYVQTGIDNWKLRYAPQQTGTHQVSLRVTDASGTKTVPVGSFTAQPATRQGFVEVSQDDPRYFEYSNGDLFWPIGMAWTSGSGISSDGIDLSNSVLNYDRPWMGGRGAYSTNWSRWKNSAEQYGNEGIASHLSFTEHYPSSELSQYMHYPEGYLVWLTSWTDGAFFTPIKENTTYQVRLRFKVENIAGPRNAGFPYGFTIRLGGHIWGGSTPDEFEEVARNVPALFPHITQDRDWHTLTFQYTAQKNTEHINLILENVTSGQAYIDEFSMREVLPNGDLGGEIIRNPKADMHTYVEQRPLAFYDDQAAFGEANDLHFRYVVHDKNDWIQKHLNSTTGSFVTYGNGYYQPENSKATWLQKQWWRYLTARYGYSTAIFGWELNNEGDPTSDNHYKHTQLFSSWLHQLDTHPHLNSTSFWCCWEPEFWGDNVTYPDVDFGDIHRYAAYDDMVAYHMDDAQEVIDDNVGKPVVRGENGLRKPGYDLLKQPNPGVWYHNMLWSQLHYSAFFEIGYWYPVHTSAIEGGREPIAEAFFDFVVNNLDLNKGGYENINAQVSNTNIRVFGQKNTSTNKAHLWIQNINHTWRNVMDNGDPAGVSSSVTFTMSPNTTYSVRWYDTYAGQFTNTQSVTSNGSGTVSLNVSNLSTDVAVTITKQ